MVVHTAADTETVESWLARFERALRGPDPVGLRALFHGESYWRDLLAFTWHIRTFNGAAAIVAALEEYAGRAQPCAFRCSRGPGLVRRAARLDHEAIEAQFTFQTGNGSGNGVLRLTPDPSGALRAWTLMTGLVAVQVKDAEKVHEKSHSRDFRGPNWLDLRRREAAFDERDPAVLVVGGGQAGLAIAARLKQQGVDTLVIERGHRVGDNWRHRYHALTLHNRTKVNHLPYMPFPTNWPTYIPKDKLAGWLEAYVEAMELNVWTGAEFEGGEYDDGAERWTVTVRRADGAGRQLRPRHVVLATGVSGIPSLPDIPSLASFRGTVLHSSQYIDGEDWAGKRALVLGTGNSGHDIAQDLYSGGALVTLVQRSPTMVVNIEPSAQLPYALYDEGLPLDDTDLLAISFPLALVRRSHVRFTEQAKRLDQDLLDALERVGFRLDFGEDFTGWQFKYLTRGGGYYFNVGCSDLIAERKIGLVQYDDLDRFVPEGALARSGALLPADLLVLATGYKGQDALVRKLFGDAIAQRVGPIWGFGDGDELRNMYVRTPQPGLWFIAGSLAQCRIFSQYLALQIKATETGAIPLVLPSAEEWRAAAAAAA